MTGKLSSMFAMFGLFLALAAGVAQATENLQANAGEKEATERLVFHQYGGHYFLAQVWMMRDGNGRELGRTKEEHRAAEGQRLASSGKKLRKIEVAAHAR